MTELPLTGPEVFLYDDYHIRQACYGLVLPGINSFRTTRLHSRVKRSIQNATREMPSTLEPPAVAVLIRLLLNLCLPAGPSHTHQPLGDGIAQGGPAFPAVHRSIELGRCLEVDRLACVGQSKGHAVGDELETGV